MKKFKFLAHTADIKFQAFGSNLENCFENAALALKKIINKEKVNEKIKKQIKVKGKDLESLLYNLLEELLFLFETKDFIWDKLKIKIKDQDKKLELNAEVLGDNIKNYRVRGIVKAITYNEMFVKINEKKHQYVCQVVVDV